MKQHIKIDAIYTYKTPFELEQLPVWSELKKYPHLCVSQTLVEGLKDYYGREGFRLLCTVDQVLKEFYEEWHNDPNNNIQQVEKISNILDEWEDDPAKDQKLVATIQHNKRDFIQALRMMIESDLGELEQQPHFSSEENALIEVYQMVKDEKLFSWLNIKKDINFLKQCYANVLKDEVKKYLNHVTKDKDQLSHTELLKELDKAKSNLREQIGEFKKKLDKNQFRNEKDKQRMQERYIRSNKKFTNIPYLKNIFEDYSSYESGIELYTDQVVLHGIHQFTPLMLNFIRQLNEMGVGVIAVFNYMEEYPTIYKTWENVYDWTDQTIQPYGRRWDNPRAIGEALGSIYERDFGTIKSYTEPYYRFDHLTSFSDYVGDVYESAVAEFDEMFKNKETAVDNEKLIKIALMDEQFYAINGSEVNELLKVYFPEQFSSRHFLTYPVGQFIRSLYEMWDDKNNTIRIEPDHIKEALSLDIWYEEGMPTPLDIFNNIQYYFRKGSTFEDYTEGLKCLKKVVKDAKDKRVKRMSFFVHSKEEIEYFEKVLNDIRRIAEDIFSTKKAGLKDNFEKLMKNITNLLNNPIAEKRVTKEELQMLDSIQGRLQKLEDTGEVTYIRNIKKTVGYYIEANTSQQYEAEWIVRDFEQIDGGILLAAAQQRDFKEGKGTKTFHYAGVSDENLLGRARKELPWPVTPKFYSTFDSKIAEICGKCRNEYNNFLRYSLFYGMYFLTDNKNICLSYIKELGDDEANPYSVLEQLMGFEPQDYVEKDLKGEWDEPLVFETNEEVELEEPISPSEIRSMETCFMRYLWNHCLDKDTFFYDEFQLERVAKFFVEYKYLENNHAFSEEEFEKYKKYMPIFDETDYLEVTTRIKMKLAEHDPSKRKHKDKYVDNAMEFIYRVWKNYKGSKEAATGKLKECLLDGESLSVWDGCKNCNQKNMCLCIDNIKKI